MPQATIFLTVSLVLSTFSGGQEGQPVAALTLAGPSFIAVRVADVDAAAAWYREVLGVHEINRIDDVNGGYSIRILSGGGLSVELIEESGVEPPAEPHLGLFKAGLYVLDLDALHAHLIERGVDADARSFTDEALRARSFLFRDLEGNRIQVFEPCNGACD